MREISINMFAVLGAAIAKIIIGALWYSFILFLKDWLELSGITEEQMKQGMIKVLVVEFIGSCLMVFVLAHAIRYEGATSMLEGMAVGFFNWLGFVVVVIISNVIYERKPFKLYLLNNGYLLLSFLVMSVILAL